MNAPSDPFPATRWNVVAHTRDENTATYREAWNELFETYWQPLFSYVRRQGYSELDAEELTQAFFANLLQRGSLPSQSDSNKRLRSYLLTALKHFLIDDFRRQSSLKRGGNNQPMSLDQTQESIELSVPSNSVSPDVAFDRQWALHLIENTLKSVEREYQENGKSHLFEAMKPHLSCHAARQPYKELAEKLGMKAGSVRIAVYRLRQRFAAVMRAQIAATVSSPDEAEAELCHLMTVFRAA